MSGSVSRSGDGWQFVIDAGLDAHGRRRQHRRRGFGTKKLAQAAMVEAQNAALHGELVICGRRTVAEYLEQWLAAVRSGLEPAGYTNYRTCLTLYVLPRLGHVQLAALTPLTLSSVYADLLRAGGRGGPLSNTTVRLVHGVVRKALNDAVLWGLLAKKPALRAAVPKRRRPVLTVWTPEQASAFLAATAGDRMQACWLLALSTGMRRGELAGLSWSDLDLERGGCRSPLSAPPTPTTR